MYVALGGAGPFGRPGLAKESSVTSSTQAAPAAHRSRSSATVYGYPRQGRDRQLKRALEAYWRGDLTADQLAAAAAEVRADRLDTLTAAGLDEIPVGDFSY